MCYARWRSFLLNLPESLAMAVDTAPLDIMAAQPDRAT